MSRRTLIALAAFATLLYPSSAQAQNIAGTWRIESSETPEGTTYGGTVTIRPNGDCYSVEWILDSGDRYSGVGLVARGLALAVAYRYGPEEGYGVVFYAPKQSGGFEGWWCQPDGKRGVEDLSGTDLVGTHRLTAGSSTGTVRIARFGDSPTNYDLTWQTSSGDYQGFGTTLETSNMMVGVWGNLEGTGVVLYSLVDLGKGRLPGWWAPSRSEGQGTEALAR